MAKLIGTGKDPRYPRGQDYDVSDVELDHHVEAGLGKPVEPGHEAEAVHRGYDTIAADPSEEAGVPAEQEHHGTAQRAASRVETTAGRGKKAKSEKEAVREQRRAGEKAKPAEGAAPASRRD